MFFGRKFPYSNMHDLNLDWIIDEIKKIEGSMDWEQLPGRIDKIINDANGEPLYKFLINQNGCFFVKTLDVDEYTFGYNLNTHTLYMGTSKLIADQIQGNTAQLTTLNNTNLTSVNGTIANLLAHTLDANFRVFLRKQKPDNSYYRAGVVEVTTNEPRMQFWVLTDPSNSNGIEHYRLPVATAISPTYYDILTTKDDNVTDLSVPLESGVEGTIVCHKYRHVLQVRLAGIHDPNYAAWKTIATLPTGYRPAESLYVPLYEANTSATAWAYIGTNGAVQLVGGSSSASLYGSFSYTV